MSGKNEHDPDLTRREAMGAGAAALTPLFFFGDDDDIPLGLLDTHQVLDEQGNETLQNFGVDPPVLAFGSGLTISDRAAGGVTISTTADETTGDTSEESISSEDSSSEIGPFDWNPPFSAYEAVNVFDPGPNTDFGDWQKSAENPVFTGDDVSWANGNDVAEPFIMPVNGEYLMAHSARLTDGSYEIGIARGTDLETWETDDTPAIQTGSSGAWDSDFVFEPYMVALDDTIHLLYRGRGASNGRIGYAYSTDNGQSFTKSVDNPVLSETGTGWEEKAVRDPSFIRVGDTYHMIYNGTNGTDTQLGYAYSTDLVNWTRSSNNPIISNNDGWNKRDPYLTRVGETNHLFFRVEDLDTSTVEIWHATSSNFTDWTLDPNNPVLEQTQSWENDRICDPNLTRLESKFVMYYRATADDGVDRIGYADLNIGDPT
jgi:predicted GH43/DUF377 family glycosyl hydrolase